ncbi:hypothetical protein [Nocardioides ochotonae]|uniref:hypothetical protein n=1 Tax=Nocardioides ochotonae TaxID=2685869 RepID=UPI00140E3850|nr:hypothetical protein [Nocardioides ochotonae]
MTDDARLLEIADELYALALAEFTPARDARAKQLRGTDEAAPVRKLRKPSTAAWVVNQLVRGEAEQVEQVLSLGAALREAQESMDGEELRALTKQRRQLTAAVTTRARAVARERGMKVTEAVAGQVEATLTAAMLDPACARAVRSGLLVAPLAATGVDPVDLADAVALPGALGFAATARPADAAPEARPALHVVPDPEADAKARAAAEDALAAAEQEVQDAERDRDAAATEVSDLEARALQLQAEIDELRRRLAELEAAVEEVDDELSDAEQVRDETEASLTVARRTRDEAAAAMERLPD